LDESTRNQIERGQRLTELLKQSQYQPASIWEQVASIYAVTNGLFDKVSSRKIKDVQAAMLSHLSAERSKEMAEINKGDKPTEEQLKIIKKAATHAAKGFEEA